MCFHLSFIRVFVFRRRKMRELARCRIRNGFLKYAMYRLERTLHRNFEQLFIYCHNRSSLWLVSKHLVSMLFQSLCYLRKDFAISEIHVFRAMLYLFIHTHKAIPHREVQQLHLGLRADGQRSFAEVLRMIAETTISSGK